MGHFARPHELKDWHVNTGLPAGYYRQQILYTRKMSNANSGITFDGIGMSTECIR
jgi:hypothetical protein